MRRISAVLLAAAAAALGQNRPGELMRGNAGFDQNGIAIHLKYTTVVEPPLKRPADLKISGGVSVEKNLVHRVMNDGVNLQSFGYDITAVPGPGADQYTVTISPLTAKVSYAPVPLPKYPPPQVVQEGDTIALDLLVSPDGSRKIVDYIEVHSVHPPAAAQTNGPARDYTPDDGPVSFSFFEAKALINGEPFNGPIGFTGKTGATLWMYAPGQGRYVLSLIPHDGFQKSGSIRDNVIEFQSDGQKYELRTQNLIIGTKGAWNLYVMHQALWMPDAGQENRIKLGTDRLDNLLKQ